MRLVQLKRAVRGFSLIEVLVAVLVLALGLLGLGAVFPMVVRQQRQATATTMGLSAINAIEQILHNNANFQRGAVGWAALRQYVIDEDGLAGGNWVAIEPDKDTGNYILPDPNSGPDVILPLSQRLYPLPFSSPEPPRFVWDLAARLVEPGNAASPIMVAVFLRPIDPGIRPGMYENTVTKDVMQYSLVNSFLNDQLPARDHRNPVSVDRDGRPTLDGRRGARAEYSRLSVVEMGPPHGPGNYPEQDTFSVFNPTAADQMTDPRLAEQMLAQQGQRFIGRSGDLYTVVGWKGVAKRGINVKVTPGLRDTNGDGTVDPKTDLNPVVFAPQGTPVDPKVFIITP